MNKSMKKIASIFDYTLIKNRKEKKAPDWKNQRISHRNFLCSMVIYKKFDK